MAHQIVVGILIFIVAVTMTMVGKGGGNFYVLILAMTDISMYNAAATGQFILFSAAIAALIIFQRNKTISWKLALIVGGLTAISAFWGGMFSHYFTGKSLKLIFACMLLIAGIVMLIPFSSKKKSVERNHIAMLSFKTNDETYHINLLIVVPVTILTGLSSGMVGVSGGSFLVPLMVIAAGVPMQTAVGTASILIAATAFMGFSGHAIQGDFNPSLAIPLAVVTIAGGIIGSRFALKSKPKNLKRIFAYTNWLAAILMVINIFYKKIV